MKETLWIVIRKGKGNQGSWRFIQMGESNPKDRLIKFILKIADESKSQTLLLLPRQWLKTQLQVLSQPRWIQKAKWLLGF